MTGQYPAGLLWLTVAFLIGVALLPIQDIFGWRDRINTPASINDENWTWRLPFPVDDLMTRPDALERATFLSSLGRHFRRAIRGF